MIDFAPLVFKSLAIATIIWVTLKLDGKVKTIPPASSSKPIRLVADFNIYDDTEYDVGFNPKLQVHDNPKKERRSMVRHTWSDALEYTTMELKQSIRELGGCDVKVCFFDRNTLTDKFDVFLREEAWD